MHAPPSVQPPPATPRLLPPSLHPPLAQLVVKANRAPSNGTVVASPTSGVSLWTNFTLKVDECICTSGTCPVLDHISAEEFSSIYRNGASHGEGSSH